MSVLSSPQPLSAAPNAVAGSHHEMAADLAPGSLLARSTIWNLIGYAAPLLVAVVVIPYLIRRLGTAEYGVLTIAWGIVGYFGVFDMGLSNAVTKFVAERIGRDAPGEINDIFHTGLGLLLGSSLCGALLLVLLARLIRKGIEDRGPRFTERSEDILDGVRLFRDRGQFHYA